MYPIRDRKYFSIIPISVHRVTMLHVDYKFTEMLFPQTCVLPSGVRDVLDAAIWSVEVSMLPRWDYSTETM